MSLPQARWLWQLALGTDPESPGALHPYVAFDEEAMVRMRANRRPRHVTDDVRAPLCRAYRNGGPMERKFYAVVRPNAMLKLN